MQAEGRVSIGGAGWQSRVNDVPMQFIPDAHGVAALRYLDSVICSGGDHAGFHCRSIRRAHRVVSVFDI